MFFFFAWISVPVRNVEAVLGDMAVLPCDILPEDAHDDVYLVLWFKNNATKPMYSLDVRGKPLNQASHWAESSTLGRRTSFRTQSQPNSLIVEDLMIQVTFSWNDWIKVYFFALPLLPDLIWRRLPWLSFSLESYLGLKRVSRAVLGCHVGWQIMLNENYLLILIIL